MRLLITGGAGFIGSNFVRYWLKNHPSDEVVNLDALTYAGRLENLKDIEKFPQYKFIHGDITKPQDVEKAIKEVDIIVHFAAESHVDRSVIDPLSFIKTNCLGTAILLNAALNDRIKRFHNVSTDEVYGQLDFSDSPFNEESPFKPRTPYAASKASSDLLVRAYFETYGLPITSSNCANNYGPYQDSEKLIPRFITNLLENKKVPLMGKGENIRPWLFLEDHCRAIEIILQKGKIGESYCIEGEEKTNLEVTKLILKSLNMGEDMIEFVPHRLGHDLRYGLDSSKLEKLGWKKSVSFDQGLKITIDWYKKNHWWWENLKKGRPNVDRVSQKSFY